MPPPDDVAHRDAVLMAEVTRVNTLLGRYVPHFLDADAGRGPERGLADRVRGPA